MGTKNVILLLLVLLFSNTFCFESHATSHPKFSEVKKNNDSLYQQETLQQNEKYIQYVISNLSKIEAKKDELTVQSLKDLAYGYAYLNDGGKSSFYFKKYIQSLKQIEEKENPTSRDLKDLAYSYAYSMDVEKSTMYIEKYIKKALEVDILEEEVFDGIRNTDEFQGLLSQYSLKMDSWVIFLFSCGLIGLFLFIVINLRKKGDFVANIMISTFVLFHSLFAWHACIFMSRYNYQTPNAIYLTITFSFLYGPLLYFYYRRISEKYKFKLRDLLHLLPSVILALYILPIYLLPAEGKLHMMFNRDDDSFLELSTIIIAKLVSLIIYGFLVYKVYRKTKKQNNKDQQIINWQRNLMILNFGYVFGYLLFVIGRLKMVTTTVSIYPQIILMSLIIVYVGYVAYVQPRVFSKKFLFGELTLAKYQKSGLTTAFSRELKEQLLILFVEDKFYKESNINLGILAQRLGTTRHNVSQVINEHFELNFFHLVNKYRILEAKEILKNDENRNLNIIDVAYDVGFNNKVTFNKAFKAETNMTPSVYLRNLSISA
jgi:AraC-like DNA-binding protein